ncbi:MAG TPA: PilZ domain-containing protein [Acidiferrobacterales bacterium]|jgi:hypothetical protein
MDFDRRASVRRRIAASIEINHGSQYSRHGRVRDISLGGVYVELPDHDIGPGTRVFAVLTLNFYREARHQLLADVRRADADGVALQFRYYGKWTAAALEHLIATG